MIKDLINSRLDSDNRSESGLVIMLDTSNRFKGNLEVYGSDELIDIIWRTATLSCSLGGIMRKTYDRISNSKFQETSKTDPGQ